MQLMHHRVDFSACGLFELDLPLVVSASVYNHFNRILLVEPHYLKETSHFNAGFFAGLGGCNDVCRCPATDAGAQCYLLNARHAGLLIYRKQVAR